MISVGLGLGIIAAVGLWMAHRAYTIARRHRDNWHTEQPAWWGRRIAGPGLAGSILCPDCAGSATGHAAYCARVGGAGTAAVAWADPRRVAASRRIERVRRIAKARPRPAPQTQGASL